MDLHDRIRHRLRRLPLFELVIDDFRRWRSLGIRYAGAHLAKAIHQTTDQPRVGVMLPTSGLFPIAMLAGWRLGRTMIPLNYLLSKEDLAFVIEDAELDAVVTVGPMLDFTGQGAQSYVRTFPFESPSCRNEALNLGKGIDLLLRDHSSVWGSPALEVLTRRLVAVMQRDRDDNWDVADKMLDVQARPLVAGTKHLEDARNEAKLEWMLKSGFKTLLDKMGKDPA